MWANILNATRAGGLNTVEMYIFWNYAETAPGVYDFTTENRNFMQFIEYAAAAGLFVNLRIGRFHLYAHDSSFSFWGRYGDDSTRS